MSYQHELNRIPAVFPISLPSKVTRSINYAARNLNSAFPSMGERHPDPKTFAFALDCAKEQMDLILSKNDWLGYILANVENESIDAVYIRGLPRFKGVDSSKLHRIVGLMIGRTIGNIFQYQQQNHGVLQPALSPEPDGPANSNSTPDDFLGHTDDAYFIKKYRCRNIALYGEINQCGAATGYAHSESIIQHMNDRHVHQLFKSDYLFKLPASFGDIPGIPEWSERRSILHESTNGDVHIEVPTYNTEVCAGADGLALEAFEQLKKAIDSTIQWFVVTGSTYLMFNNNRGVHAREAIPYGNRRVYRSYWTDNESLQNMRTICGTEGHVFDATRFLEETANYQAQNS